MTENSPEMLDRIVDLADRFDSAWRGGVRPRLEDFLDQAPPSLRAETLHTLLRIEIDTRRQLGESPHADEYAERFAADRDLVAAVFSDRPGAAMSSPTDPGPDPALAAPAVPGYRIVGRAFSGPFSEVWLAEDEAVFQRPVALKMILGQMPAGGDRDALARLRGDVERLAGVRHPNVVQAFGWLESADRPGLVLQSVSGGSLGDRLERDGPLTWRAAARYTADVAEGLAGVHARGVVHRDIQPANILWDPQNDEAVLTSLGVGVRLRAAADAGALMGFAAPEAFDGRITPALDVHGLAATLFALITGQPPFSAATAAALVERASGGLPESDPRCVGMPIPLERIIRDGLTADPEQRPTLDEFVSRLRGSLNRLLADSLAMASTSPAPARGPEGGTDAAPGPSATEPSLAAASTRLRLIVSRQVGPNKFVPIAAIHDWMKPAAARDAGTVPPEPDQVMLRTGDRMRIEAVSDRPGFITVFKLGPAGELGLLYPDELQQGGTFAAPMVRANQTLQVADVAVTRSAGRERLLAVWSRQPLSLRLDRLQSLADPTGKKLPVSRSYLATRDMVRLRQSVERLPRDDWKAASVELDHTAPEAEPAAEPTEPEEAEPAAEPTEPA